jgi:hypothetical protein
MKKGVLVVSILLASALMLFGAVGCSAGTSSESSSDSKNSNQTQEYSSNETIQVSHSSDDIVSVSYSSKASYAEGCFSFSLRATNGAYLFTCSTTIYDSDANTYTSIELKDKKVSEEDWQTFISLTKEYNFARIINENAKSNSNDDEDDSEANDETTYTFSLGYNDGSQAEAISAGEASSDLLDFFNDLALNYKN